MKPAGLHVCLAASPSRLYDPELLATVAVLLTLLVSGGLAIYATCRWYRNLKHETSSQSDDLDQLARVMEDEDELGPEERQRLRAALQRHKQTGQPSEAGKKPGTGTPQDD
jgi:hypothetical protein